MDYQKVLRYGLYLLIQFSFLNLAKAEINWAYPRQYNIAFTRGNELGSTGNEFFAKAQKLNCLEGSEPITVYIQILDRNPKAYPLFMSITQLCPESENLAFLRKIKEGKVPQDEHIGMWKLPEPFMDPGEFEKPLTFRTRNAARSRQADEEALQERMDRLRANMDANKRTMDALEQLAEDLVAQRRYHDQIWENYMTEKNAGTDDSVGDSGE